MSERKPGYIGASERAERRWKRDAEQVISENLAHVVPNEPQKLPPAHLDDRCWKHDYVELEICKHCGVARERA